MRTLNWEETRSGASASVRQWTYTLLVEDIEVDGFHCESYGILVCAPDTGEKVAVRHITVNGAEALVLLERVARLAVSPVTLRDVVEDYLAR